MRKEETKTWRQTGSREEVRRGNGEEWRDEGMEELDCLDVREEEQMEKAMKMRVT